METIYLCIGYGITEGGKAYSRLAKVVEYDKDKRGNKGGFVDLKQCVFANEILPIGELKTVTTNIN